MDCQMATPPSLANPGSKAWNRAETAGWAVIFGKKL
jgi:hypothetical protein